MIIERDGYRFEVSDENEPQTSSLPHFTPREIQILRLQIQRWRLHGFEVPEPLWPEYARALVSVKEVFPGAKIQDYTDPHEMPVLRDKSTAAARMATTNQRHAVTRER